MFISIEFNNKKLGLYCVYVLFYFLVIQSYVFYKSYLKWIRDERKQVLHHKQFGKY